MSEAKRLIASMLECDNGQCPRCNGPVTRQVYATFARVTTIWRCLWCDYKLENSYRKKLSDV